MVEVYNTPDTSLGLSLWAVFMNKTQVYDFKASFTFMRLNKIMILCTGKHCAIDLYYKHTHTQTHTRYIDRAIFY